MTLMKYVFEDGTWLNRGTPSRIIMIFVKYNTRYVTYHSYQTLSRLESRNPEGFQYEMAHHTQGPYNLLQDRMPTPNNLKPFGSNNAHKGLNAGGGSGIVFPFVLLLNLTLNHH